jgi:hypothetical protein
VEHKAEQDVDLVMRLSTHRCICTAIFSLEEKMQTEAIGRLAWPTLFILELNVNPRSLGHTTLTIGCQTSNDWCKVIPFEKASGVLRNFANQEACTATISP